MQKQRPNIIWNAVRRKFQSVLPMHKLNDNRGVAAVEFALIVPILMLLFIGTLEISLAVSVDRKVSRISSSMADLITQGSDFNKSALNDFSDIAKRIMTPYSDEVDISIVAIEIQNNRALVAWSHAINKGEKPQPGIPYPVPKTIKINDTFLIATTVSTSHKPALSFVGFNDGSLTFDDTAIELSEQMFLRPRLGKGITCSDCNS